jgi:sugar transferase (PEP-CTERM/EpsH1 system associated)
MTLRIMHVVNNLGKGGLENGVVNLINAMDAARFEHVVCTIRGLGGNANRLPQDRVQVVDLAGDGAHTRLQMPSLVRVMRRVKPDVVHSRNWGAIEAVLAARCARVGGVVHSEHGLERSAAAREPRRRSWVRRLAYELADRVLAVSDELRLLCAERTGYPAKKIQVIHNGVDRGRFAPDPECRARIRREFGIGNDDFCVGSVANLLPVKDHMTLLEAVNRLPQTIPWRLILAGDGSERATLERFVDERTALRGRVTFLGSTDRVPEILQAFDAFVLASLSEGICNALLEAMSTGLCVIATDVGGNPEIVVHERSGLLFPVRDVERLTAHLQHLAEDATLRQTLGDGALRRVRDSFSMDSMVRAYEALYEGLRSHSRLPALSAG